MSDFDVYLGSLLGSWQALAAPHADAQVVVEPGWFGFVSPSYPVFSNAVLLDLRALEPLLAAYDGPVAV